MVVGWVVVLHCEEEVNVYRAFKVQRAPSRAS